MQYPYVLQRKREEERELAEFLQRFTVTGRAHSAEDDVPEFSLKDILRPSYVLQLLNY